MFDSQESPYTNTESTLFLKRTYWSLLNLLDWILTTVFNFTYMQRVPVPISWSLKKEYSMENLQNKDQT